MMRIETKFGAYAKGDFLLNRAAKCCMSILDAADCSHGLNIHDEVTKALADIVRGQSALADVYFWENKAQRDAKEKSCNKNQTKRSFFKRRNKEDT